MKIVVAPNAFKGSLSAAQAAEAIQTGIRRVLPEARLVLVPVADGGDGLVEVLAAPLGAQRHVRTVSGPLGARVRAAFLYCPERRLAVIEMASAAGLALLPTDALDPLHSTTRGVGQLLYAALELGARHVVLGIGGSATTDGATGLAASLGVRFLDREGHPVTGDGANLERIEHIDLSRLDPRMNAIRLEVACDVDNPLLGARGAAAVYAPQKGANATQTDRLEQGLAHFAKVIQRELAVDVRSLPGGGAAGGMGAGLKALFQAQLRPGAQLVLELLGVEDAVAGADLVFTGEGRLDRQTAFGKAPGAVASLAQKHAVPCIALAGALDESAYELNANGFSALFSLSPGARSLTQLMEHAEVHLARAAEQALRCLLAGRESAPERAPPSAPGAAA